MFNSNQTSQTDSSHKKMRIFFEIESATFIELSWPSYLEFEDND